MGQRANLVIVRRQDWRLYYDHWRPNRLDIELFWGPRLAAEFIEQREPDSDLDGWLDEVWCEGAAILDEDRKALLWYGGEDFEAQLDLASIEIQLPHREISDLQRSELHRLRQWRTHLASNPAREIAPKLGVSKINPWTDVNRSSAGSETEKLQLLEVLESRVPIRHS